MSETKKVPIVSTPELAGLILARSLAVIEFVEADELRLKEYMHDEFRRYRDYAKANNLPAEMTGQEFAEAAAFQLAFVKTAIKGLLTSGSVAPKAPEIGAYL